MKSGCAKTFAWLVVASGAFPFATHAIQINQADPLHRVGPADISCVIQAAVRQGVPANVLLALASVEGGKNGQLVRNTNGTYDVGHFQINTIHFAPGGIFGHIKRTDAAWRGCYNAELAAFFLRKRLDAPTGKDYWTRVANYHSATPKFNSIYRAKLVPLAESWGHWLQANYNTAISYN